MTVREILLYILYLPLTVSEEIRIMGKGNCINAFQSSDNNLFRLYHAIMNITARGKGNITVLKRFPTKVLKSLLKSEMKYVLTVYDVRRILMKTIHLSAAI